MKLNVYSQSANAVFTALCVLCAALAPASAFAVQRRPSIAAVRTDRAPVIDGLLSDACWAKANVATGFTETQYNKPVVERTFVRVLYDDKCLYVGFECMEPHPEKILATVRKRDRFLGSDDRVDVRLDTFNDRRSGYIFIVNTLGTVFDARQGLFGMDSNWDSNIVVACKITSDRWFAEMAIPITDMHFEPKDNATWGINFFRIEKGRQEYSIWSYLNQKGYMPRNYGELTGLNLGKITVKPKPQFETYLSSTATLKGAGTGKLEGGTNKLSTGIDMSLRLNSQWVSAFTYNPDFGQVEADADTIELRDTERFLPEKRTFFREGAELFETPLNFYYSRRFLDIETGAKLTGQASDWAMGMIDVLGTVNRSDEQVRGHYNVGRLIHYIGEDSHIGGIWSSSNRTDGTNFVTGLDSKFYLNGDNWISTQVLGLKDTKGIDTDGKIDHSAYAMKFSLTGEKKPYNWNLSYLDITRGFVPDLGYIPRRDIRGPAGHIFLDGDIEAGPVKWIGLFTDFDYYHNHNGELTYNYYKHMVGIRLRNELEFRYYRADRYHAPYYNRYNRFLLRYNRTDRWHSISASYERGVFEAVPYDEYGFEKPLELSDRMTTKFELDYRIEHPRDDGDESIWLWRSVTEYTWPSSGRIKFTAEDTAIGRYNLTLLFIWPIRDNIDYYFVLNDYKTDGPAQRGVFNKIVYRF